MVRQWSHYSHSVLMHQANSTASTYSLIRISSQPPVRKPHTTLSVPPTIHPPSLGKTPQKTPSYPPPSPPDTPYTQNGHQIPSLRKTTLAIEKKKRKTRFSSNQRNQKHSKRRSKKQKPKKNIPLKNRKFVVVVSAPALDTGNASNANVLTPNGTRIRFSSRALNAAYTSCRTLL